MILNIDPDRIVDELMFDLSFDVIDAEAVIDLISCSGSSDWGYDTYHNLKTWFIEPDKIGFSVDIYLDGIPDDDTSILGTSILAKIEGEAVQDGERWEVSSNEVLKADFYSPHDDDENQMKLL